MPRNISSPFKKGTKKPKVGEVGRFVGEHESFTFNEFVEVLAKQGNEYTVESLITGIVAIVDAETLQATN